MNNNEARHLA
ncbi:Protein of unknown function [Thermobacillus xylanilyticus]|uniref:Uncharacterized protein n=1 Tax=Thermobacillus xylanilyticus TaxID=76633 RepID=A0ABM8V0T5_THEXY|nr:Protein of unknown function [Thermobacillus xylanilyticus]